MCQTPPMHELRHRSAPSIRETPRLSAGAFPLSLNLSDILFKSAPRSFHNSSANHTAEPKIRTASKDLPALSAAGVWLFHCQDIIFPNVHV